MKHTNLDDDSREITNAKAPRLAFLIVGAAILGLAYLLSGCTAANRLTPEEIAAYQHSDRDSGLQND